MEETDSLIKQQLERLPPTVQKALNAFDWKEAVKNISTDLLLTPEQGLGLETEVLLLIYSFEPQENFYNNLLYKVGLTPDVAEKVFDQIELKVLKPLTEEVEKQEVGVIVDKNLSIPSSEPISPAIQTEMPQTPPSSATEKEKDSISIPDYSAYESGKDPYREPVE